MSGAPKVAAMVDERISSSARNNGAWPLSEMISKIKLTYDFFRWPRWKALSSSASRVPRIEPGWENIERDFWTVGEDWGVHDIESLKLYELAISLNSVVRNLSLANTKNLVTKNVEDQMGSWRWYRVVQWSSNKKRSYLPWTPNLVKSCIFDKIGKKSTWPLKDGGISEGCWNFL